MKKTTKSKLKGIDIVTHINKTIEEYGPIKSVSLGVPNKLENLVKTIETEAV